MSSDTSESLEEVMGIPVYYSRDGEAPGNGKYIVLWRYDQKLYDDGYYIGTAIGYDVIAVRNGIELSRQSVRITRWRQQTPRWFNTHRLRRAKKRAAELLLA